MITYRFRPIDRWPRPETTSRKTSPFFAKYEDTLTLLNNELEKLRAHNVVIQADVTERDIRADGMLRSDSKPRTPRLILSFDLPGVGGSVQMPCDTYPHWKDNLRAIALSLEALRKVNRYGVTKNGEQYRGWRQLPGAVELPAISAIDAARWLAEQTAFDKDLILGNQAEFLLAYRTAVKRLHPDTGATNRGAWDTLQVAAQVLRTHHGVRS
jgi:hypothetical protein